MKHVLITGGSRGIGRSCVELFSKSGYLVSFIYNRSDDMARELAETCNAFAVKADITKPDEAEGAVSAAIEKNGKIDVLINNAGVSQIKLFSDTTYEDWHKILNTNLSGMFYITKPVSVDMVKNHSGRIINIGSIWGNTGASCEVHYSASKAGVRGLTLSLAKELGPSGITVNCIEPGVIDTDMNAHFGGETIRELIDETPLCRIGKPEDVAQLAYFLASDNASFITGQIIGVDGGFGH